jgi:cellulose synthase/poly-beta-1,6-N-acetylglucosamine synthase-like glycosyltransferase
MVTGEYVILLSADEVLAPGSLRRAVSLFERQPSGGVVHGYAEPLIDVPHLSGAPALGRSGRVRAGSTW